MTLYCRHCLLWDFGDVISPDSKVRGANMGPTWVLSAPGEPNVGPMNLAIRECFSLQVRVSTCWRVLELKVAYKPANLWGYSFIVSDTFTCRYIRLQIQAFYVVNIKKSWYKWRDTVKWNIIFVWIMWETNQSCIGMGPRNNYRQTSNTSRYLAGNNIVDYSDVVGISTVGAVPSTSLFPT